VLSADPKAEQCGWLKDKYGLPEQIAPTLMPELLGGNDKQRIERATQAFLKMKKFDIGATLRSSRRVGSVVISNLRVAGYPTAIWKRPRFRCPTRRLY
jgi:hypothetical protein